MKVSGQFLNVERAKDYGKIKSYLETCRRHGKNEIEALRRLFEGNPYTVDELFGEK